MTTPQMPDLRPVLLRAFDVADSLVGEIGPDDLDRPTPCAEYAVRDLVDHMVLVVRRIRTVLDGRHFAEAVPSGETTLDGLRKAWADGLAELRAAAPGFDLSITVTVPFGTIPAGAAVGAYVSEVAVHSWDLAAALGRTDLLDQSLAGPLLAQATQRVPKEGRESIPFGPVVEVAADAPAYDRLVAWMGRDPQWKP